MVLHDKKLIFVHVPKTAGTTLLKTFDFEITEPGPHADAKFQKFMYKKFWDDYFKFAFVRNPYDRIYSLHSYFIKKTEDDFNHLLSRNFEEFVLDLPNMLKTVYQPYTQIEFIGTEMDFIGRFENLEEDYLKICRINNIKPVPLKIENKSEREKDYRTVYTPKMKTIVEEYFKRDLEIFQYFF